MSATQMEQVEKKKLFDAIERKSYNDALKITEVNEHLNKKTFLFLKSQCDSCYFPDNDSKNGRQ
jgi:hypothetical protein